MTLSLSMLNIITPPERLIEVLIASTILFVALNNFYRWVNKEWQMAFVFGFIHGFGFANALREMNVDISNFVSVVLGFNSGVEVGQLMIIATLTPFLFMLKSDKILKYICIFTIGLSSLWIIDRAFALHFMPF
jgi:predicted membrane channel-forming protein YqfA (hemolysin III family)